MNFLKNRRARKELKDVLHYTKHVRHMHEDIADPQMLDQLQQTEEQGRAARQGSDPQIMKAAAEEMCALCEKIAPPRPHHKIRENVEVLFVAIAAAMAIRAYIFQPFKIPTGSMQPTLYGITIRPMEQGESDILPVRIAKFFWKGEVFLEHDTVFDRLVKMIAVGKDYVPRAQTSGYLQVQKRRVPAPYRDNFDSDLIDVVIVGKTYHDISPQFTTKGICRDGEYIKQGESLIKGVAKAGDYILVNRMKYNFFPPKRGDIVVFDAEEATGKPAYYIKRLVGLPGETISVDPPYLQANGEKPTDPRFDKLFNNDDYSGYVYGRHGSRLSPLIAKAGDAIELNDDEYLFFGDNTKNSLDGRYFGGVKREQILGSAFFVGLPFDRAGFAETVH